MNNQDALFLNRAIELSRLCLESGLGGPFGCVVVKDNNIVAEGFNQVTSQNDPTAHAEIVAIRNACLELKDFQLTDCTIYTSCEPCPMCLGAIYWARPKRVVFANTKKEAMEAGFDDQFIYDEIATDLAQRSIPFEHLPLADAKQVFIKWQNMENKKAY